MAVVAAGNASHTLLDPDDSLVTAGLGRTLDDAHAAGEVPDVVRTLRPAGGLGALHDELLGGIGGRHLDPPGLRDRGRDPAGRRVGEDALRAGGAKRRRHRRHGGDNDKRPGNRCRSAPSPARRIVPRRQGARDWSEGTVGHALSRAERAERAGRGTGGTKSAGL